MSRASLLGWLLCGLALVCGCGPKLARVEGQVTYDGEPVKSGYVSFTPADGNGSTDGGPIENGKYSVPDILPGPKVVLVTAVPAPQGPISSADLEAASKNPKANSAALQPADIIPADAQGNSAPHEIQGGHQTLDLHLQKPAGKG